MNYFQTKRYIIHFLNQMLLCCKHFCLHYYNSNSLYSNQECNYFLGASLCYLLYLQTPVCTGAYLAATAETMILGYFFSLQPGAKLARAHPPKYRPITSLQIMVWMLPAETAASLTRPDAFRQWSSWQLTQCPQTHIAQPICLACCCQEACLCRQLAGRWEYIWRSSESRQGKWKHQISAKPKIGF